MPSRTSACSSGSKCLDGVLRKRLTTDRAIARIERNVGYGGDGEKAFARQEWHWRFLAARTRPVPLKLQLRIVVSAEASRSCTTPGLGRPTRPATLSLGFVERVGDAARGAEPLKRSPITPA